MLGLIATFALIFAQNPAAPAGPVAAAPKSSPAPAAAPAQAQAPAAAPTGDAKTAAGAPAAPNAAAGAAGVPAVPGGPAAKPEGSPLMQLLPFLPVVVIFYFLVLRPNSQTEKKRKEMLGQIGKNDRVVTAGGMYATVLSVDKEADTVLLRLGSDPGVKVEFLRSSVVRVLESADKPKDDKDK